MTRFSYLAFLLPLLTPSLAVNVLFATEDDCSDAIVQCSNLLEGDCCTNPNPTFAPNVKFTDYPATPTWFGSAFTGGGCGTNCNSAPGTSSSICLGCDPIAELSGASWNIANGGKSKRGEMGNGVKDCKQPDTAWIGGEAFHINYHVPVEETEQLLKLVYGKMGLEHVPAHLHQYRK